MGRLAVAIKTAAISSSASLPRLGRMSAIGRWKQVIGDGLRSRIDERRVAEVNVAVDVLNRTLELGRPSYVRII